MLPLTIQLHGPKEKVFHSAPVFPTDTAKFNTDMVGGKSKRA